MTLSENYGFESGAIVPVCYPPDTGEAPEADAPDERAAQLNRLLEWFTTPAALRYFGPTFERRIVALMWTVNPAVFKGKSLSMLARDMGITKQALSRYAAMASRVFGIRNRAQFAHGGRWRPGRKRRRHKPGQATG